MNPSTPLDVALVGVTPGASNCDPAINLNAPNAAALLSAYERSRSDADRLALPLMPDGRLMLFRLQPLTAAGVRMAMEATGIRRLQNAVLVACHEVTDAKGVTHKASDHGGLQTFGKLSVASDEWLDFITMELGLGGKAVSELGSIVVLRAEAGPSAVAPFALPLGLMLPR